MPEGHSFVSSLPHLFLLSLCLDSSHHNILACPVYILILLPKPILMLPSMRYSSAKLSELVHQQKSYRLHMTSVDKIKAKNNNQQFKRTTQLDELKERKEQSFSYTNHQRSKEISHVNQLLYSKIYLFSKIDKKYAGGLGDSQLGSLEVLEGKILERNERNERNQRSLEGEGSQEKGSDRDKTSPEHGLLLKNHPQYPIHKSTLLERTRENIRLAKKIVNPVITYRTQNFARMHQENKQLKARVMRYEPELAKTKTDLYVERKMSLSFMERKKSQESLGSFLEAANPENSLKGGKAGQLGFQLQRRQQ